MYRGIVRRCVASASSSTAPVTQASAPPLSTISILAQKTREDPIQNGSEFWQAFQTELDSNAIENENDTDEKDGSELLQALVDAHPRVRDPLHARGALNIALPNALVSGAAPENVVLALSAVRHLKLADRPYMTKVFQLLAKKARKTLDVMSFNDMLGCLDHFAALSVRGFAYPRFFLLVLDHLYETWHKAQPEPEQIVSFIKSYAKAGVRSDKMNKLFAHIASPEVSGEDCTWSTEQALAVCRAMVFYKFYTKDAIQAMLTVAAQDPNILEDPHLLRSVKIIEMCLRLELHAIQATLKPELNEFLEVLREAPYHDPSLEADSSLTYQLRGFLKKHGGNISRQMVGPWPVQLADMDRRAAFMCLEDHMSKKIKKIF